MSKRLTQRSEQLGYDLTLIAELNLNDIKGVEQPALDAWSTAAALAAVTETHRADGRGAAEFPPPGPVREGGREYRPHRGGRLALNVVSSWWADEAKQYGLQFDQHDDRYARTEEWLTVVDGLWTEERFSFDGQFYRTEEAICAPKPAKRPTVYAGGESEKAKAMIVAQCDAYVMHGDPVEAIAPKIADMAARREAAGGAPMQYGMAAYAIVRDSEAEAKRELERITDGRPICPRATTISTSGCRARSSSASSRSRNIRCPTAACAPIWSARPSS